MKNQEFIYDSAKATLPFGSRNRQDLIPWAQALLDASPEPIILVNPQGTLLFLNKAASEGFGGSVPLIGQRIDQQKPGASYPIQADYLMQHIGAVLHSRQSVRFQYDHAGRVFENHYRPILDRSGKAAYVAIIVNDISKKRRNPVSSMDRGGKGRIPLDADRNSLPIQSTLTPTEIKILHLIQQGKSTKEIAQLFHRSHRTIEVHRYHLMVKFGAHNIVDLMKRAACLDLLNEI